MRQQLGGIHEQLQQCQRQDDLIGASAKERLDVVQARLQEVGKTALTNPESEAEYLLLVKERATLARVLGRDS